jgi:hypothetical protein
VENRRRYLFTGLVAISLIVAACLPGNWSPLVRVVNAIVSAVVMYIVIGTAMELVIRRRASIRARETVADIPQPLE